jgi:nicotinamide riboside transporter PnuC
MLLYSPRWLFFYPGIMLMLAGTLLSIWVIPGPKTIGKITFDVHTLLFAVMAIISGYQAIIFAMLTKIFASVEGLVPEDPQFNKIFQFITLETGLVLGAFLMLVGAAGNIYLVFLWGEKSFGSLDPVKTLRIVIPSFTLFTLGFQTILSSFFFSILGMGRVVSVSSENQASGNMLKDSFNMEENIFISIVIPVFNEEKRIESFLSTVITYLLEKDFSYEIVIVDDGSTDQTVNIINSMLDERVPDKFRIIKLDPNIGKGGAVRKGMLEATGEYVFFVDADGATPVNEIDSFIENLSPDYDVYIGKRAVKESTRFKRIFLGYGYTILANCVLNLKIFDYTCGFKCYSHRCIEKIFSRQTLNNWSFDTEDLFIASKYAFKINAIPVKWQHIEGSKVKVLQNVFVCALDLLKIRINNMKGLYS